MQIPSESYLQQVVGELLAWTEGAGKSAVKMMAGNKVQVTVVKHKMMKGRELMWRVSDGDAPTAHNKTKVVSVEDYAQEFEIQMDAGEKKSPTTRSTGSAPATGSSTTAADQEPAADAGHEVDSTKRRLEFDELISEKEMRALRGARQAGDVKAAGSETAPPAAAGAATQPDWLAAMQGMFDRQGDRMEFMFRNVDERMTGLENVLINSTVRTQQRMREMEESWRKDMARNNDKQEDKFGAELRRLEVKIEGLGNGQANNQSLEERLRKLELKENAPKMINQEPQRIAEEKPPGWVPSHVILGGPRTRRGARSRRRRGLGLRDSRRQ